jgi:hypothetical protein
MSLKFPKFERVQNGATKFQKVQNRRNEITKLQNNNYQYYYQDQGSSLIYIISKVLFPCLKQQ